MTQGVTLIMKSHWGERTQGVTLFMKDPIRGQDTGGHFNYEGSHCGEGDTGGSL